MTDAKINYPCKQNLSQAKNFDPRFNENPSKIFFMPATKLRIITYINNVFTNATQVNHLKIRPIKSTNPRNPN